MTVLGARRIAFLAGVAGLALWSGSASAQGAAPSAIAEQDSGMDIIVTAQRRDERLQNVPVSITALGQQQLRDLGSARPSDIFAQVPNLKFQAAQGGQGIPIFNIRGVTLLDFTDTNEPSVAVYADDVYLGSPHLGNQQLFDIQRVEVLRGPQGTLYGRNAVGGLINFISNRPTDVFSGYATAGYGKDNNVSLEGAVSGPLADDVRARLSGRFERRDGWQTNVVNGSHFGDIDHAIGVRAIVEAEPTDRLKLALTAVYNDFKGEEEEAAYFGAKVPGSSPAVRCSDQAILASQCVNAIGFRDPNPEPRRVYSDLTEQPIFVRSHGFTGRADYDLGFATLTSLSAYYYAKRSNDFDADASPMPALRFITASTHKQFSEELRLGGTSGALTWTTGFYYYTDTRFFTVTLPQAGGLGDWVDQDIDTWGVFGQATYAVTPTVNLTGGIRYTHDKRSARIVRVTGGQALTRLGTPTYDIDRAYSGGRVTWRVAGDWHFNPDHMLYASIATGFKSVAFNTNVPPVNPDDIIVPKPETITSYEVGVKGDFGRTFSYNLAGFYSDYKDVQAQGTFNDPIPRSLLTNIGDARIVGLEAEIRARPTSRITVTGGLGLLDAKIKAPAGAVFNGVPLDGNRMVVAPKVSFNGMVRYDLPLADDSKIWASTNFTYQSKVYFGPDNLETEAMGGYGLINIHLGWDSASGNQQINAFIKNVTNKEYFIHGNDSGGATQDRLTWGRERTWGIQLTQRF